MGKNRATFDGTTWKNGGIAKGNRKCISAVVWY